LPQASSAAPCTRRWPTSSTCSTRSSIRPEGWSIRVSNPRSSYPKTVAMINTLHHVHVL
jgi:hypothetical protein